jgi:hypothetical protein
LGYRLEQWDLNLAYRPGDFIQVNAGVNEAMVAQALDWLKPKADERVLDLFCGLGNFALPLAKAVREVVAVEGVQVMVDRMPNGPAKAFVRYSWTHRVTALSRSCASSSPWGPSGWCMCRATLRPWRATRSN